MDEDQQVQSPEVCSRLDSGRVRESRKYDISVGGQIVQGL